MEYNDKIFSGERALYRENGLKLERVIFDDGESPLKHAENVDAKHVSFRWKYPLWYAKNVRTAVFLRCPDPVFGMEKIFQLRIR